MKEIEIGGRKIPLLYTTMEMIEIQEKIGCTAFELKDEVFGIYWEDEDDPMSARMKVTSDPERLKKFGKLIMILGNAGLEENGEEPNLTDKWILRHMKPPMILNMAVAVVNEIAEGNRMESPKTESGNGPVDEGLEDEIGKKQQGS